MTAATYEPGLPRGERVAIAELRAFVAKLDAEDYPSYAPHDMSFPAGHYRIFSRLLAKLSDAPQALSGDVELVALAERLHILAGRFERGEVIGGTRYATLSGNDCHDAADRLEALSRDREYWAALADERADQMGACYERGYQAALTSAPLAGREDISSTQSQPCAETGAHIPSSPQNFQDHGQRAARVAVCDINRGQNSEIEPDEEPRKRGCGSPDQEGSGSGEIRGRNALLSGGLQRSKCVVRAEDSDGVENVGRGKSPAHPSSPKSHHSDGEA